jgi:hypothetical protein
VNTNPYEAPRAPVQQPVADGVRMEAIASGQKLVIYSVLVYVMAIVVEATVGAVGGLLGLAAVVMAIVGIVRLGAGMGMSLVAKILLFIAVFLPFINLITLLVLNARATRYLRQAGYRVGLLGASK